MHRTLQYAILFIVMVILQIFLFSRIGISVYVHPLVCIAFIVLLPMEIAPLALLGLGLLLGVTLDFFMATAGIHTVAALNNVLAVRYIDADERGALEQSVVAPEAE